MTKTRLSTNVLDNPRTYFLHIKSCIQPFPKERTHGDEVTGLIIKEDICDPAEKELKEPAYYITCQSSFKTCGSSIFIFFLKTNKTHPIANDWPCFAFIHFETKSILIQTVFSFYALHSLYLTYTCIIITRIPIKNYTMYSLFFLLTTNLYTNLYTCIISTEYRVKRLPFVILFDNDSPLSHIKYYHLSFTFFVI